MSNDSFVHLCGRRYVHRTESQTEIKVYSNQPRVTLFVDGKEFAAQDGGRVFKFTVPISGTHEIKAVAGSCTDCMTITKADKPDPTYRAEGQVENWFDDEQSPAGQRQHFPANYVWLPTTFVDGKPKICWLDS